MPMTTRSMVRNARQQDNLPHDEPLFEGPGLRINPGPTPDGNPYGAYDVSHRHRLPDNNAYDVPVETHSRRKPIR